MLLVREKAEEQIVWVYAVIGPRRHVTICYLKMGRPLRAGS
jgi:hypothetical protein